MSLDKQLNDCTQMPDDSVQIPGQVPNNTAQMPSQVPDESVQMPSQVPDVVVITGMSGAGRTEAMHIFEDMGYYAIDNLPPSLITSLTRLVGIDSGIGRHLAVVCDVRSQGLFDMLEQALDEMSASEVSYTLVYLDAADDVLLRRFSTGRRRHPLAREGETNASAIKREREQLERVLPRAHVVIDTSHLRTNESKHKLESVFSELSDQQRLEVHVFSFGFKYGMPAEADLVMDVRFLPNPYYDLDLRARTGNDAEVISYVMGRTETQDFCRAWFHLLDTVMPGYVAEGKSLLSIAIGCTGGQHRSVVLANETADHLRQQGYRVSIGHRDLSLVELVEQ